VRINANNSEKLRINELETKFNGGEYDWVGTTIDPPITEGIYKLFVFHCYLFFYLLKFTCVDMARNNFSFFFFYL
jgi:hypothetical protein